MSLILAAVAAFHLAAGPRSVDPLVKSFEKSLEMKNVWPGSHDEFEERKNQLILDDVEIKRIKKAGFTAVRVRFDMWFLADADQPGQIRSEASEALLGFAQDLQDAGLAVLLTLERANQTPYEYGDDDASLLEDHKVGREVVRKFWARFAQDLKDLSSDRLAIEPLGLMDPVPGSKADLDYVNSVYLTLRRELPSYTLFLPATSVPKASTKTVGTFDFEEPFVFTHQGSGPLGKLQGMPWPPSETHLSVWLAGGGVDDDLRKNLEEFVAAGWGKSKLREALSPMSEWRRSTGLPAFASFGIERNIVEEPDRLRYLRDVREVLESEGLPWTIKSGPQFCDDGAILYGSRFMEALGLRDPED